MEHDTLSAQWAGGVRDGYPAGVPCWVAPGQYFVARLHGRDVAAISSIAGGDPTRATWNTYVWVDNADETAQRVQITDPQGASVTLSQFKMPE